MPPAADPKIPEEVLRSEREAAARQSKPHETPGPFGLPGLPDSLQDALVKYTPYLLLGAAAFSGFSAVTAVMQAGLNGQTAVGPLLPAGASVTVVGALIGITAYPFMVARRQVGWYLAVTFLVFALVGQLLMAGTASILTTGIEIFVSAYLMMSIRHYYHK